MGTCALATTGSRAPFSTAECKPGGKYIDALVTLSSSYATGGDTVDLSGRGFSTVDSMIILALDADRDIEYKFIFVPGASGAPATAKILVALEDGTSGVHADVTSTTDLSNCQLRVRFEGT